MELRVLQYFLAVAREQNISAAAQSLHLTQPTLSRQLKELEEELGKQLMVRGNRKITLTEDGMLLRNRAEEILELVDRTEKEVMQSGNTVNGDIYIGTGETDGVRQIVGAAKQLRERYPGIHFHIVSGDAVGVCERLDKGLLDFGVLLGDMDKTRYHYMELPMKDTWGVLMRKDSPLAQEDVIQPQDLWDKPLILSAQKTDAWPMSSWFGQDITRLNIVATYNLVFNASLLVEEGLGYAVCFDKLINVSGDSKLCFRPLSPKMEAEASIIWKRYQLLSKAAQKFMDCLKESCEFHGV